MGAISGCDYVKNDWAYCGYCLCYRPLHALRPAAPDTTELHCVDANWCMNESKRQERISEEVSEEFNQSAPWEAIERIGDFYIIRHRGIAAKSYRDNADKINARRKQRRNKNKPPAVRTCEGCPKDISDKRPQAKYCSPTCQKKLAKRKAKK